jgi:hypothetical protein
MHVPAICLLTLMIYTRCSQAIAWRFADVCGSERAGAHDYCAGLAGLHGDSSRVGAGGVEYGSPS